MPCNAVATVRASVQVEGLAELMANEKALGAVKVFLEGKHGQAAQAYWAGGRAYTRHGAVNAPEQVWFVTPWGRITLFKSGLVTVDSQRGRAHADQVKAEVETFLGQLRGLLTQERVKAALKKKYALTGETRVGQSVVYTLEV